MTLSNGSTQQSDVVLDYKPETLLVEFHGIHFDIRGVEFRDREDRQAPSSERIPGTRLVERTNKVRIQPVVLDIMKSGLLYRESYWQYRGEQHKKVYVLVFAAKHDLPPCQVPNFLWTLLQETFQSCLSVWANLRFGLNGERYRLDVIQVANPKKDQLPQFDLMVAGAKYQLRDRI